MAHNPFHGLMQPGRRPSMQFQQLNPAFQSDPRRILGQTLMGQGTSTAPVRTPLEGLGRLSSALVGAYLQRKAGDEAVSREDKARDALLASLPANASPMLTNLAQTNPGALQTAMATSAMKPTTTAFTQDIEGAPGAVGYGTKTIDQLTGAESTAFSGIYKPPAAKKPLDKFRPLNADEIAGSGLTAETAKDFQINETTGKVSRLSGAAPTVNITQEAAQAGETEFAKGMAQGQIAQLNKLSEQANLASENEDAINSILTLYNRAESEGFNMDELTGPGADFKLDLKETFATVGGLFGFDYEELGIDVDTITDQQSLRAAFNELSLEMTKKLRGAISEKELTVATRATANFGNTPEANRMILLTQRGAAAKARAVENEAFRYINGDGTEQNRGNGNLGPGTMDGKKYNSFQQYQREFVNRDKEFVVKQVVPEINSIAEMKALVKISGGLNNLSEETIELMDERLAQL